MTEQPNTEQPNTGSRPNTGEPRSAAFVSWLVLFGSFALSADTWIALAQLGGFTDAITAAPFGVHLHLAIAWCMPVVVDGYVVTALILWTSPVPADIAEFARKNTYAAAGIGVVAQAAYHALSVFSTSHTLWRAALAAVVGAISPGFSALAVHMRALVRRRSAGTNTTANARPVRPTVNRPLPNTGPVRPAAPNTPIAPAPANTPNAPAAEQANDTPAKNGRVRPPAPRQASDTEQSNVRPITAGRAARLQQIKDARKDWRTNVPSVRECGRILGIAPSSALPYQQDLVREANTPSTQTPAADSEQPEPDREPVAVGQ